MKELQKKTTCQEPSAYKPIVAGRSSSVVVQIQKGNELH